MLKVNNKKTINNLATKSFNANKLRNIFVIVAITLTTILFTSLFTVGSSLIESMQESTMRQVGSNAHGTFKNLNMEEYEKISQHKSIKEVGYSVVLGFAENKELIKRPTEIRYTSGEWQAKSMFAFPTRGRLPEAENEIATDAIVLDRLGIPSELGQNVIIEYSLNNEKITDTFTLVGFWEGDSVISASEIWLSPSYVKDRLLGYKGDELYGKINADVSFANSFLTEKKMQKVIDESGLEDSEIHYGVNWAYAGNGKNKDLSTILGSAAMIALIVFSGYLIISNIFYISIIKDIQYYGLLKAVGTTSKQIKKIIKKQVMMLCVIGIPIGLTAGFLVGEILTPAVLDSFNVANMVISLNPVIFIGAAVFSVVTVFISTKKPSRIAAKVSAIEAIRNTENSKDTNKKVRTSKKVNPFRMAKENIFRNRKKLFVVTVSLSLSLVILNCTYSVINGFDMNKYLSNSMVKDFAVADAAYFNVFIGYQGEQTLNKEFLSELYSKEGISERGNIYFSEINYPMDDKIKDTVERAIVELDMNEKGAAIFKNEIAQDNLKVKLHGLDDSILEELECFDGEINMNKFKSGKYVIASAFRSDENFPYYKTGDTITINFPNGSSEQYEVMAIADIPFPISQRGVNVVNVDFFLPSGEFSENMGELAPMVTTFDVSKNSQEKMEDYLADYCKNINKDMQYISKATFATEFEGVKKTYFSVGIVVSVLLAFIGITNFVNTTITSLIARKRGLAMLQSIGMTSKQMKQMLISEGLIYVFLTELIVLFVGSPIGYLGIKATMSNNIAFSPAFTALPSLICLPVFVGFVFVITLISYKSINRKSIVERLREVE